MRKNLEIEGEINIIRQLINSRAKTSITNDDVIRISKQAAQEQFMKLHLKSMRQLNPNTNDAKTWKSVTKNNEKSANRNKGFEIK